VNKLFLLITLSFLFSTIIAKQNEIDKQKTTEQPHSSKNSCETNGFNYTELISFEKSLQNAVKKNDIKAISNMVDYPVKVNTNNLQSIWIYNKAKFMKNYRKIFSAKMIKNILDETNSSEQNCSWRGAGFGNLWLHPNRQNKVKIYVINYDGDQQPISKKILGNSIPAVSDPSQLKNFLTIIHKSNDLHKSESLPPLESKGFGRKVFFRAYNLTDKDYYTMKLDESGILTGDGCDSYKLYTVNIKNEKNYILTCDDYGGTMHSSGVIALFIHKDKQLFVADFNDILKKDFHITAPNWYTFIDNPFLTHKNNKYFMHFTDNNVGMCSYMWEKDKLEFIGSRNGCVSKK
jgi:hypothetical protein